MKTFIQAAGGIALVVAASTTCTNGLAATYADGVRVVSVPCATPALVAAITAANTDPADLRLASSCTYTIDATPLPTITGKVILTGGRSTTLTAGAGSGSRLLSVAATGNLRAHGLAVRNATAPAGQDGGGIRNEGELFLDQVTIDGSTAGSAGGGLSNAANARAFVSRSVITGNRAGATSSGGGIANAGRLTLFASRVAANNAPGSGAGVATAAGGTTRVVRATIEGNVATGDGGGVANAPGGTTTLERTLVTKNTAASGGGVSGTVTLRNSVVRGNTPDNCVPTRPGC